MNAYPYSTVGKLFHIQAMMSAQHRQELKNAPITRQTLILLKHSLDLSPQFLLLSIE